MLRIWLLSCLFLPLLAARDFAPRKPEPGYAATRTFEWKSARALEQRAEKLAGGKLHIRKVGEKSWRANASRSASAVGRLRRSGAMSITIHERIVPRPHVTL